MAHHVLDGDVQRVFETEHHHAERVTHQDEVDAAGRSGTRRRCVVGGDHHKGLACTLAGSDTGRAKPGRLLHSRHLTLLRSSASGLPAANRCYR